MQEKKSYLKYNIKLTTYARSLRAKSTNAESRLWFFIRRKQILNIQFYRQKPVGPYIVDFYAPKMKLVIEIDGSQHFETLHIEYDKKRDQYLNRLGLTVLRFDNWQVMYDVVGVLEKIYERLEKSSRAA